MARPPSRRRQSARPWRRAKTALIALGLSLLSASHAAHGAAPATPAPPLEAPPAECEAAVTADPADREAWRCFYLWARRSGTWTSAQHRLQAALAADPANAHARLNLGHLHSDRGDAAAEPLYLQAADDYAAADDAVGGVHAHLALANLRAHVGRPPTKFRRHWTRPPTSPRTTASPSSRPRSTPRPPASSGARGPIMRSHIG